MQRGIAFGMTLDNAPSKTRFAPKIPTTRIKKEEAIKLGNQTTIQEVCPKQTTEPYQTSNLQKRKERLPNAGLLVAGDVQGPFSLGPATFVKSRNADATSILVRGAPRERDDSKTSATKTHQQVNRTDSDIKPAVSVENNTDIDNKAPVMIKNNEYQATPPMSLAEMFGGQLALLKLPVKMPLIESMPKASEISHSMEEELTEQTVDLESLKQTEQASQGKNSPFTPPWPSSAHGKLGKIKRYASGKMTLTVGNIEFQLAHMKNANPSVTNALVIDGEYNQAFDLGNVKNQLVAIPDISKLLL